MINFVKKLLKSNIILIVLAEKLSTSLKINFEKEYKIVSYIDKPIILDVGGHKGESILNFKKFNPKSLVYSFEPNLNLYKKIKKNFLFDKKIKIYNFAISNKKNNNLYIPYALNKPLNLWASFNKKYLIQRWKKYTNIEISKIKIKKIKVVSKKLDQFKIKSNLLKIDTEGSVLEVIKSGLKQIKKYKPLIILEFNSNNFDEIKKTLYKLNYKVYNYDHSNNKLLSLNKKEIKNIYNDTNSKNLIFYNIKSKILKKADIN